MITIWSRDVVYFYLLANCRPCRRVVNAMRTRRTSSFVQFLHILTDKQTHTDAITRLPSNLRPTTREYACIQLRAVMFGLVTKMAATPFDLP